MHADQVGRRSRTSTATARPTSATRIQWSFLVKNTGNVDARLGSRSPTRRPVRHLPGDHAGAGCIDDLHGDAPYTITQADVDAGVGDQHRDRRRRRARRQRRSRPTPSSTNTPVAQTSALQLTKSAAVDRRQR